MNRLRWQLFMIKHQLGWVGLIGFAGLTYAAIYFYTMVAPTERLLNNTRQALIVARAEQVTDTVSSQLITYSPIDQLQRLINKFPNAESINTTWEQLAKLTEKSGLTINHVHYESSPEKHAGLLRYQYNIPVMAVYPQIRDFLAEVIQTIPNVALEQLSFKRESVDSPLVSANIDLVIYVRSQ